MPFFLFSRPLFLFPPVVPCRCPAGSSFSGAHPAGPRTDPPPLTPHPPATLLGVFVYTSGSRGGRGRGLGPLAARRPSPVTSQVRGGGLGLLIIHHFPPPPAPSPGLRLLGRPSGCASPSGRGGVPEGRLLRDRARGSPLARCSPCEEGEEICRFWFLLPVANTVGASRGVPLGSRRVGANTSQPKEGFGQPFGKGETATCTTASARNFCHFFRIA